MKVTIRRQVSEIDGKYYWYTYGIGCNTGGWNTFQRALHYATTGRHPTGGQKL